MTNYKTTEILESILANSYGLSLKTQNYHWNVTGENFKTLHELFGEQYEDISDAIDELAERIRALGEKVEGTFANFSKLNSAKDGKKDLSSKDMVNDLISDHEALVAKLNEGIKIAQEDGDEATADMFIARIQSHDKMAWMLRSSL